MIRTAIFCLFAASLLAAGCSQTLPPMGASVQMAVASQKLNPTPAPDYPVTGLDGVKSRALMELYQVKKTSETRESEELQAPLEKMGENK